MSALNQAFIKAYNRESGGATAATAEAPPPQTAPTPGAAPSSVVLENWYTADAWYRAESAPVAPSVVPAPHLSFPAAPTLYQAPTAYDLNRLSPAPLEETDYRLSPPEAKRTPELVIEDDLLTGGMVEETVPDASAVSTARIIKHEQIAEISPSPIAKIEEAAHDPLPVGSPAPSPLPTQACAGMTSFAPPVVAPDFAQMYAPVQVVSSWEALLSAPPPITTVGPSPVPVVAPPKPKTVTPPAPVPAPVAVQVAAAPHAELAAAPVKTPVKEPVPVDIKSPRMDAAVAPPVPKPHTSFAPAPDSRPSLRESSVPVAEAKPQPAPPVATPSPAPKPTPAPVVAKETQTASSVATPEAAPLGLLQPAWEVDRFQWPEHCRQLLQTESEYLSDVGARLANAARDGLSILAITSTRRGEGRTTLSLCLARAAAQAGVKVALVDADLENPQLVNELGVEAACGWHDVVLGTQPLSEAAIVALDDKVAFFPWTSGSSLKTLNDPRVTKVLRTIAKAYSLVILDLGPVPGRETRLFEDGENCPVDAAILVRDVRWTSAIEAQRVAAQLTAAGVDSVGIAENFGPRTVASGQ